MHFALRAVALVGLLGVAAPGLSIERNHALRYQPLVMVPAAEQRLDKGQLKFCEKANLHGMTCMANSLRSWWSPESYIKEKTGISNAEVVKVERIDDGGMFIYFNTPDATITR